MRQISEHLWRIEDSCAVYVAVGDDGALCVDFGTGAALAQPPLKGWRGPLDVLLTHHHRDQAEGLPLAVAAGARVWAPETERDLLERADEHWQSRALLNDYNPRQDRFTPIRSVPLAGALRDYATYCFAGLAIEVVPTPGHTTGSITLLAEIDGQKVAFTGDLIAAPGKVWSLAATQWSYNGNGGEGLVASILSLLDLKERRPDMLLPSHGEPIVEVDEAIDRTVERLWELVQLRGHNLRLLQFREQPYVALSEHLLWNRTSLAYSYVLRSDTGEALVFDFGYDFVPSPRIAAGADRASRRPWLYTLPALQAHGVERIGAVIPTHYHDDHVAGLNLLRDVTGAKIWAAESFADILERPERYNLLCLWYESIAVDRVLPLGQPIRWNEFELTLHPLPGHTRYAVAISLTVDGRRVLIGGDQYDGEGSLQLNYVYANGFALDDYAASAALYRRLAPELILSGHQPPFSVGPDYLELIDSRGEALARLHRELLPEARAGLDAADTVAMITPYQAELRDGETIELEITVRNPAQAPAQAELRLVLPEGWQVFSDRLTTELPPAGEARLLARVMPHGGPVRRARVAAEIWLDGAPLGQQAECLISVTKDAPMNTISFMTANYVARQLDYHMTGGWGQGDKATQDFFRPIDTFAERFEGLLDEIAGLGFTTIDLWTGHLNPEWATPEHIETAKRLLADKGFGVSSLAGWFGATLGELEASCKLAVALGCPILGGSTSVLEADRAGAIGVLQRHGVVLGLENHPEKSAAEILAKIGDGQGRIGVCLDTGWFGTHGYDAAQAIEELGGALVHVHLKDVLAAGAHDTCAYGEGVVPVERCVRALQAIGYTGGISVEHEPEQFSPNPGVQTSYALLREWLAAR